MKLTQKNPKRMVNVTGKQTYPTSIPIAIVVSTINAIDLNYTKALRAHDSNLFASVVTKFNIFPSVNLFGFIIGNESIFFIIKDTTEVLIRKLVLETSNTKYPSSIAIIKFTSIISEKQIIYLYKFSNEVFPLALLAVISSISSFISSEIDY